MRLPESKLDIGTVVELNNGVKMPMFGLGVYQLGKGKDAVKRIHWAFEVGYRHVDTAALYGNEREVGEAVRTTDIPREDIFVTTKLWNDDHGYERALEAFDESMEKLGLEYVDLYLIHWPVEDLRLGSWRALEKIHEDGRARAIGISNFTIGHIDELLENCKVVPAVNQVEFHPWLFQKELMYHCWSKGIALEAYSPLVKGDKVDDPAIRPIAKKYGVSPAQVLIRWGLQHKVIEIPKSSSKKRIRENAAVFDLEIDDEDMSALDSLNKDYHCTWDPTDIP